MDDYSIGDALADLMELENSNLTADEYQSAIDRVRGFVLSMAEDLATLAQAGIIVGDDQ